MEKTNFQSFSQRKKLFFLIFHTKIDFFFSQEAPPAPNLEMSRYPLEAEKKSRPQYRTVSVSSSSSAEC